MSARFKRTMIVGLAVMAILLASCGGSTSTDSTATTDAPTAESQPDDAGGESTTTAPADDAGDQDSAAGSQATGGDLSLVPEGETDILGNPAGQGYVEFEGVRYDFVLNAVCTDVFGAVQAGGKAADGSDASVDALIPPEDWESDTAAGWDPPYVEIEIGDASWRAAAGSTHNAGGENVELTADQSAVTTFTNNGSTVEGEAVFFSEYNYDEVETASGTFLLYCPGNDG